MPRIIRTFAGLVLAFIILAGGLAGFWSWKQWRELNEPRKSTLTSLTVNRGSTFHGLIAAMHQQGLVENPAAMKLYARFYPKVRTIKAGEYAIAPEDSTLSILGRISRGEVIQRSVTIPEGWNIREIAPILAKAEVADAAEFSRLVTDPAFAQSLGINAPTLEGYLFPDTYHFAKNFGAAGVIKALVGRFRSRIPADYEQKAAKFGLTVHQAVTLASVIEKETGAEGERRLISAVFHNRLNKKMRLQSDPTVIYGIVNYDGNIRKKDLLTTTPYNTYRINGLPYGPIANPGLDALLAVVDPAPVDYLYFVGKGDGTHYFSSNLVEHNRAVRLYQLKR